MGTRFVGGALVFVAAIAGSAAQQGTPSANPQGQIGSPPNEQAPIVIPPATVGLAAAPDELQKALDESTLPKSVPDLLTELTKRADEIQSTVASGAFGQVWVPAMATKTVALVLESHTSELPAGARLAASKAIKQIVTAAWELDTYGDLGDKGKIDASFSQLSAGVSNLKGAYAVR
jgi:hypothetical protein